MAILSKAAVKLLFETGDQPTESNFADLIDTATRDSMVAIATAAEGGGVGIINVTGSTAVTLVSASPIGLGVLAAATTASAQSGLGVLLGTDALAFFATASTAEAEAGTGSDLRAYTPTLVKNAIEALTATSLRSYLAGLTLSNDGGDTEHRINVAVGVCTDDGNAVSISLDTTISKDINSGWSVGDDTGGLDTGAVANSTWYHLFLIRRSDTGVVDALFSVSATAPTLPTNYDQKRRIGAVLTDGSANILAFTQVGDHFQWTTPILDIDVDPGTDGDLRTLSTPLGISTLVEINSLVTGSGANQVYYSNPAQTDGAPSLTAAPLVAAGVDIPAGAATNFASNHWVRTNTSSQIRSHLLADETALRIATLGWIDERGRDD